MEHCALAWEDFYKGTSYDEIVTDAKDPVEKNSNSRYYLKQCIFIDEVSTSVSFSSNSDDTLVLVEDSIFSNCSSQNAGGSISFSTKGRFSQQRICSYKSKTTSDGVFCKIVSNNQYNISIKDSSISSSGDDTFPGSRNIYIIGSADILSVNSSFAKINGRCLFDITSVSSNSAILFSTFSNNTQKGSWNEAWINGNANIKFDIKFCNFMNNKGTSAGALIYLDNLALTLSNCSFQGNSGNSWRFYKASGSYIVEYCYITDRQGDGNNVIVRNILEYYYTALLSHFSSNSCDAENPIIYSLLRSRIIHFSRFSLFILSQLTVILSL